MKKNQRAKRLKQKIKHYKFEFIKEEKELSENDKKIKDKEIKVSIEEKE